jgi:hypothetical protein
VIDVLTGQIIWKGPAAKKLDWWLWSPDSHQFYFTRSDVPGVIAAHDLTDSTDHLILDPADAAGFFSVDGESYFYRDPQILSPVNAGQSLRQWLKLQWGWQQENVASRSRTQLGRVLLQPREQTQDGLLLMSRDEYVRVRYGLYQPQSGKFAPFVFPTDAEDLVRAVRSQAINLVSVLLYGALAVYMFLRAPHRPPSRALYIIYLILMILFASLSAKDVITDLWPGAPWNLSAAILAAKQMTATSFPLVLRQGRLICLAATLAILPAALLHFELAYLQENQFLAHSKKVKLFLYVTTFLPLASTVLAFCLIGETALSHLILIWAYYLAGVAVFISALFAFLLHRSRSIERRAGIQFRSVILILVVPPAALAGRELLHILLA